MPTLKVLLGCINRAEQREELFSPFCLRFRHLLIQVDRRTPLFALEGPVVVVSAVPLSTPPIRHMTNVCAFARANAPERRRSFGR